MTSKYEKIQFSERIKKIIELVGSAEKLANISGMSSRVIGQYLAGKSDPSRIKLIALADAARVNIEWLAIGKGPMKPSTEDTPRYDEKLLQAVIKTSESYWIKEGKNLSPSEKADTMTEVYNLALEMNVSKEGSEIMKIINISEMLDTMMKIAIERMADPVHGEKFRKGFETRLKKIYKEEYKNKEELEFFIDGLIGAYTIRKHLKEGTLKYPVKDEDGTIRMIDFKDLNKGS